MNATAGYVKAKLLLDIQGSQEPTLLAHVSLPIKVDRATEHATYSLAVDLKGFQRDIEAIFRAHADDDATTSDWSL